MPGIIERLLEAIDRKENVALATVIRVSGEAPVKVGSKLLVKPGGQTFGDLDGGSLEDGIRADCLRALREGRSGVVRYTLERGQVEAYIEVMLGGLTLLIIGAGHIAQPLAQLGKMLDFRVVVLDDREAFANRERFPEADEVIAADFGEALDSFPLDAATYIILVTRGHKLDEFCLRRIIGSPAAYIGMIGSRRRVTAVFKHLSEDGVSPELIDRVYSPIGLDIGAETPAEIAVSIMAEVVKLRRGGTGMHMALKERRHAR